MNKILINQREFLPIRHFDWNLWRKWVFANTVGEVIGLGAAALVGIWAFSSFGHSHSAAAILATALIMIVVGTFEGVIVGIAQSLVLRQWIKDFDEYAWFLATAIGAFLAWTLGGIPSVVMSLQELTVPTPPPEMSDPEMYGMAAIMGLVLGLVLGMPQWLVLRNYVNRAGWWLPANAVAWGFGMPLVFAAAGNDPPENAYALMGWFLFVLSLVGVVVGAIHGLFLVWLMHNKRGVNHE